MIRWLKSTYPDFFMALVLTCVAAIVFVVSLGTTYHQFAIGLLASTVAWLLLIISLEACWRLVTGAPPLNRRVQFQNAGTPVTSSAPAKAATTDAGTGAAASRVRPVSKPAAEEDDL